VQVSAVMSGDAGSHSQGEIELLPRDAVDLALFENRLTDLEALLVGDLRAIDELSVGSSALCLFALPFPLPDLLTPSLP
jgi:hypothetical protein